MRICKTAVGVIFHVRRPLENDLEFYRNLQGRKSLRYVTGNAAEFRTGYLPNRGVERSSCCLLTNVEIACRRNYGVENEIRNGRLNTFAVLIRNRKENVHFIGSCKVHKDKMAPDVVKHDIVSSTKEW